MNKKNLLWFTAGSLASSALSFISIPIIAWAFDDGDIGRASLLVSSAGLTTLCFGMGLDQAYTREYHESRDRPGLLMNAALPGGVAMLIVIAALMAFDPHWLSGLIFGIPSTGLSWYVAGYALVVYASRFLTLSLRMQEDGRRYALSLLIAKLGFVTLILLALLAPAARLHDLLWAHGASVGAGLCYLAFCERDTLRHWRVGAWNRPLLRAMLGFGIPAATSGVLFWGLEGVDKFLLRTFSTYDALGVYSIALSIAAMAAVATTLFTTVWIPVVYRWVSGGEDLARIDAVSRHALAVVVFIVGIAGAMSWILRYVLPAKHALVQQLVAGCMMWPLCYALSETTGLGIAIRRATRLSLFAAASSLAVNVALNLALLPRFGAAGATAALAAGIWLFFVIKSEVSHRIWRPNQRGALYGWTACALMLGIAQALCAPDWQPAIAGLWALYVVAASYFFRHSVHTAGSALAAALPLSRGRRSA